MNRVRKSVFCTVAALMLVTALSQVAAAHWDRPAPARVAQPALPDPFPFAA
jgi:hypothetical protein